MAIVGAASAFVESTLAQIWKVRGKEGEFRGGPAYYIEKALGKRWLGILFAVLLILCFAFGFNGLQAFNATSALEYYIPDYATNGTAIACGIVLAVMTAFVIFGGAKRISVITSIIVPIMAIGYPLQHHGAAGRVRDGVRLGLRRAGHLRRIRGFGGHAGHQARPVL